MTVQKPNFTPFEKLKVCGNIIGTRYIFQIDDYIPLIVGKSIDNTPLVWAYAKLSNNDVICVVNKNSSNHRQISCENLDDLLLFKIKHPTEEKWIIFFKLIVSKWFIPEIVKLDLRPFGLNIYGDDDSLFIGNTCLKDNNIVGSEVFFKIGK